MIIPTLLSILSLASQSAGAAAVPAPDVLDQIACAPSAQPVPPLGSLRVLGGYIHGRIMFTPGDPVILNAGRVQGLQPGQQFFVRRHIVDRSTRQPKTGALYGVHTAGWLTVTDVKDRMSTATVTHACDAILEGDFLEPFVPPIGTPAAAAGTPDFAHPAQIVMADERRQTGYPGLVMVMNRGTESDVRAGQTLTIYRETLDGNGPVIEVGRGTVLSVAAQSAIVRIDSSREAVYVGDLIAIHRST